MKEHPDKHIRKAIATALARGWILLPAGKSAHCFGRLVCGVTEHREHMMSIWSTPAVPENHARQIIRMVKRCPIPATARIMHKERKTMPIFNFTLTLSGVTSQTPGLEDALFAAGCSDALVCFYGTAVYLEFDREGQSLEQAALSAIRDVETAALPSIRVESIDSTLVGLSDIAELIGVSRQAIALLKEGARGSGRFPGPVQRVKGNSPLWRWKSVVEWLVAEKRIAADSPMVANALLLDSLNLALQLRRSPENHRVQRYLQSLSATSPTG